MFNLFINIIKLNQKFKSFLKCLNRKLIFDRDFKKIVYYIVNELLGGLDG